MTAPRAEVRDTGEHESAPGMSAMTLIYNALFLLMYLFYFYLITTRWKVS
jgi:hypothetical protein